MEKNILVTIHRPLLAFKDVMLITKRGKDYCRVLVDRIYAKHKRFYDEHYSEYRGKYIKDKHLYEMLGFTDEEYYKLFSVKTL